MEYQEHKAIKNAFLYAWGHLYTIGNDITWQNQWGIRDTILSGAFIHPTITLYSHPGQIVRMIGLMGVKCLVIGTVLGSIVIYQAEPGSWDFKLAAHPDIYRAGYLKKEDELNLSIVNYLLGMNDAQYSLSQQIAMDLEDTTKPLELF